MSFKPGPKRDRRCPRGCPLIAEVEKKIDGLVKPRNFTFRPVLMHVNGVENQVIEARYFDAVIAFGELWR